MNDIVMHKANCQIVYIKTDFSLCQKSWSPNLNTLIFRKHKCELLEKISIIYQKIICNNLVLPV